MLVKIISGPKPNQQFHTYSVKSSHLYSYPDKLPILLLEYPGAAQERVQLYPGETVYTMNGEGKTIDKFVVPPTPTSGDGIRDDIKFAFNPEAWNAYAKQHNLTHYSGDMSEDAWDSLDAQTQRDYLKLASNKAKVTPGGLKYYDRAFEAWEKQTGNSLGYTMARAHNVWDNLSRKVQEESYDLAGLKLPQRKCKRVCYPFTDEAWDAYARVYDQLHFCGHLPREKWNALSPRIRRQFTIIADMKRSEYGPID